MYAERTQVG